MAIAWANNTKFDIGGLTDPSLAFTPSGTPRGIVFAVSYPGTTDVIAGITYGGVAMTEVTGSPNIHSAGATCVVHVYFLGASIPTGTQNLVIDSTTAFPALVECMIYCLTATTNTEIVDVNVTINSTSLANPSVTLSLGGRTSWAAIFFGSGQTSASGITPLTNWAAVETVFAAQTAGYYRYSIVGSTNVTAGWTQAAEDATAIAIAVSEVQAVSATLPAAQGAFTLTRNPANFLRSLRLAATPRTYAVTGPTTGVLAARRLTVAPTAFGLSGNAVTFTRLRILTAGSASFALSGQAAIAKASRLLTASVRSLTLTATSTGLYRTRVFTASSGAFTLTRNPAILSSIRQLLIETGTLTLTGSLLSFIYTPIGANPPLAAAKATFTLMTTPVSWLASRLLITESQTYTFTGKAAVLTKGAVPIYVGHVQLRLSVSAITQLVQPGVSPKLTIPMSAAIRKMNGNFFDGTLRLMLSTSSAQNWTKNVVVIGTEIQFPIRHGGLPATARITPNDVLRPAATNYRAQFLNPAGTIVDEELFTITGTEFHFEITVP
jgi:hypothetical protein